MAEYIEREILLKKNFYSENCNSEENHWNDYAIKDIIRHIPAADVAPVVHGEWVPMHHRGLGGVQRVRGGLRCKRQWWNDRLRAVLRLLQILPHLRG